MTTFNDKEVFRIIQDGLKKVLGEKAQEISLQQKLIEDIGVDSFASIELIFDLEEQFGIKIADEDFIKLVTVKDVVDYIMLANPSKKSEVNH